MTTTLRLILGDQLDARHGWLRAVDPRVTYTLMEVAQETGYVTHHSRLSFALNVKLIRPMAVMERALEAYRGSGGAIALEQVEGFVRQILGWREYLRCLYWRLMPGFERMNFFGHDRPLPAFYWTGQTRMRCLAEVIGQSLSHAYAHHIQRLMVTGSFALLAGVAPAEVERWYLGIYIDAVQWVELPNTLGMSQYADGGILATKPYVSSARYIQRMSDYCSRCGYRPTEAVGQGACPFNALYWNFMEVHRGLLERNPRLGMVYRTWDRMAPERRKTILNHASRLLSRTDEL